MNLQGSFGFGQGYTVHWDKPKTNGTGRQKDNSKTDQGVDNRKGREAHGCTHSWDDPDWSVLDDRRGDLPEFPVDTLSSTWQEWVTRAAHGAGATPAHVAVPLLGIASSLIGTARRVMTSRSWTQPMTIWTGVVGFSGTSKTPGIDATKRALSVTAATRLLSCSELMRAASRQQRQRELNGKKTLNAPRKQRSSRWKNIAVKLLRSQ
jgi:Protein of unknown function (DUF3987)